MSENVLSFYSFWTSNLNKQVLLLSVMKRHQGVAHIFVFNTKWRDKTHDCFNSHFHGLSKFASCPLNGLYKLILQVVYQFWQIVNVLKRSCKRGVNCQSFFFWKFPVSNVKPVCVWVSNQNSPFYFLQIITNATRFYWCNSVSYRSININKHQVTAILQPAVRVNETEF